MVEDSASDRMQRYGVYAMEPKLACNALGHALDHDGTAVVVADLRWETYAVAFTGPRPSNLLNDLPDAARALAAVKETSGSGTDASTLRAHLADLPEYERDEAVLDVVRAYVANVLGYPSADAVDPNRAFTDLGFDSLTAVELRNGMSQISGLKLSATLVFDYPTCAELARFVRAEFSGDKEAAPQAPVRATVVAGADDEPIAIVAMSCRFPGGVRSPEQLWRMLHDGDEALVPFPTDRGWDLDALYDPEPGKAGSVYTQKGGFLDDAGEFDPSFFGISPREALAMDPQQRLLLETSWEAFERAGHRPVGAARQPHRRLRRHQRPGLHRHAGRLGRRLRGVHAHRQRRERRVRPAVLHVRS